MRFILLALSVLVFFAVLGCQPDEPPITEETQVLSPEKVDLRVQVLDEFSQPLASASVVIEGQNIQADAEGWLSLSVPRARLYQLGFSAQGYFTVTHTFSENERARLKGQFPAVILVEQKPGRVMLAFGGDAVVGRRYHQPNPGEPRWVGENSRLEDTKNLLTPIKPYLELADYVSINLESPVLKAEPEERSSKTVVFFSYPETLDALEWVGVDYVSLGNNHTYDYHAPGMDETLDYLDNSRLGYSGSGRNEQDALAAYATSIKAQDYRFLGYVGWPGRVEPNQIAEPDKGGAAWGSLENIRQSVAAQGEETVTVAQYHGSREYSFAPTDETRERLYAAIDSGADLIVGHHPHVLHGFELYQDKLIAYSLGNFMFDQYIYETHRSALLYVWMDGDQFHRAEVVPLYINGYRPTPAVDGIRDYVLRRLTHQSSVEGLALGLSGGHGVLTADEAQRQSRRQALTQTDRISKPLSWAERLDGLAFNQSDISYRVGTDTWSLGDFEHQGLHGIANLDWQYSQEQSGIALLDEFNVGHALKLIQSADTESTWVGQKYFTRAWNADPKSVVLSVAAPAPTDVRVCLELRAQHMTTMEARANPVEQCLPTQQVNSQEWQQLVFDFEAPAREDYRGMRVRLDFSVETDAVASVLVDEFMIVSWSQQGVSEKGRQVDVGIGQFNVVDIGQTVSSDCCELIISSASQ